MVVMYDLIPRTYITRLESKLRACTKKLRECTVQSSNVHFEVVEGYEPLGLKVVQRIVKVV